MIIKRFCKKITTLALQIKDHPKDHQSASALPSVL